LAPRATSADVDLPAGRRRWAKGALNGCCDGFQSAVDATDAEAVLEVVRIRSVVKLIDRSEFNSALIEEPDVEEHIFRNFLIRSTVSEETEHDFGSRVIAEFRAGQTSIGRDVLQGLPLILTRVEPVRGIVISRSRRVAMKSDDRVVRHLARCQHSMHIGHATMVEIRDAATDD